MQEEGLLSLFFCCKCIWNKCALNMANFRLAIELFENVFVNYFYIFRTYNIGGWMMVCCLQYKIALHPCCKHQALHFEAKG